MKVLIVEEDEELRLALEQGLEEGGVRVDTAATYTDGMVRAALGSHDVIVLDVMLPGGSGVDLCQRLRAEGNQNPVLFLTALGAEDDRIKGFHSGGDDYLPKPFSGTLDELVDIIWSLMQHIIAPHA